MLEFVVCVKQIVNKPQVTASFPFGVNNIDCGPQMASVVSNDHPKVCEENLEYRYGVRRT